MTAVSYAKGVDLPGLWKYIRTVPDWGTMPAWFAFTAALVAAYFTGRNHSIAQATRV